MSTITASGEERDDRSKAACTSGSRLGDGDDRPLLGVGHSAYPRAYNRYDWSGGRLTTAQCTALVRVSRNWVSGMLLFL